MKTTLIGPIFFMSMLLWPIIINSQPGTTFIALGIDWKADNLDNTLFWTAIILTSISILGSGWVQKIKDDKKEKLAKLKSGI